MILFLGFVDPHCFSLFRVFHVKYQCYRVFLFSACISVILGLCTRIHTHVKWLKPVQILTSGIRAMEDPFGGIFKLAGSNYSMWKSEMRDMLMCEDMWLPVQFRGKRPDKVDAATWEVLHLKPATYKVFYRHAFVQRPQ